MIEIIIPGRCQPKQRPRYSRKSKCFFTPRKTRDYEKEVGWYSKMAMKGQKPISGLVKVEISIQVLPPRSWRENARRKAIEGIGGVYPPRKDVDNMGKSVLDGMNGIVYGDDAQICMLTVEKKYAGEERVVVRVSGPEFSSR